MDTANDPRLLVAERALEDLEERLKHGHIKAPIPQDEVRDAVDTAQSALQTLKYTYADPEHLVEMDAFNDLETTMADAESLLGGPSFHEEVDEKPLAVATARWAIDLIDTLKERLFLPGEGLQLGVTVEKGHVISARDHPDADDLLVTRVAAGRGLTVVTNDATVSKEDDVGVALLPPTELRGVVSEGMFLGAGEGVLRGVEAGPDGRPAVEQAAYHETQNMLTAYLNP